MSKYRRSPPHEIIKVWILREWKNNWDGTSGSYRVRGVVPEESIAIKWSNQDIRNRVITEHEVGKIDSDR